MSSRWAIACLPALLAAAGCDRQSDAPLQANTVSPDEAAPAAPPPAKGASVDRSHKGEAMPALALFTLDNKPAPLAGYRGRPLLVNLWATWCAPCVAELPSLDQVAATVPTIVVNQGEERDKVLAFAPRARLTHARTLLDPAMAASIGLGANLPTTILYDAAGKEVWRVTGGRDWASAASAALLAEAR